MGYVYTYDNGTYKIRTNEVQMFIEFVRRYDSQHRNLRELAEYMVSYDAQCRAYAGKTTKEEQLIAMIVDGDYEGGMYEDPMGFFRDAIIPWMIDICDTDQWEKPLFGFDIEKGEDEDE